MKANTRAFDEGLAKAEQKLREFTHPALAADLRLCLLSMARRQLVESLHGQPCHVRRISDDRWQVDGLLSVDLDEAVRMLASRISD